ncbi:hypothetical protein [Flavobacterium degerlachei]|uniref:Uncharacterized protein n=1 Tax=Flavobacterium degerlachei TaxID=229203 RepID=A0A1H3E8W4_9FLAO|nr:hypothetical protein [Flavobacterium degerlachei]SDX74364.1 hypothetical protein SAMN05444338_11459 [Flavobacterium degerlachei]
MIENIFEEIREICNHPWKRELLLQDKIIWNRLWASLDVIEDSQIAINDYTNLSEFSSNTNGYLYVYGILQALNLQQDALVNLNKALFEQDINFKEEYPELYNIRENRNNSIGHPTDRGKGKSFHHITRGSIKKEGFEMISLFPKSKGDTKFEEVNILSCIEIQNKLLNEILNNTMEKLKSEFDSHMNKFKEKKLIDIVPRTIDYHFSKLYEDCSDYFPLVKINFDMIFKIYNSIKQGIIDRYSSLAALPGIELNTKMLDYLFDRLNRDLIKDRIEDEMELQIFIDALKSHFDELKSMIIEIDEEFST